MAQKMMLCFTSSSAEILLCILKDNFCAERHILLHFSQWCYHELYQKLSAQKLVCFGTETVGEIIPLGLYSQHIIFLITYKLAQYARALHYSRLEFFVWDKHSSFLKPFVSYTKNEVL